MRRQSRIFALVATLALVVAACTSGGAADDGVTITGNLNDISVSTAGSGHWDISLTLHSSNGKTMNIENSYPFPSSFRASQACSNAAYTFGEAVQDTVNKTLKSGKFRMLIRK